MQIPILRAPIWLLMPLIAALPGHGRANDGVGMSAATPPVARVQSSGESTETWQFVEEYQFYLQTPPGSLTAAYRSQGMATDGSRWFFSWQFGLEIADDQFNTVLRNSSIEPPSSGIPWDLLSQGLDHIGDIDYYNGIIYASLDDTHGYTKGHVALYSAADLTYTGVSYSLTGAPSNPHHDIASWVAVDGPNNVGYGKEWQLGNTINVYRLNDWVFDHALTLDMPLERIQGAKVHDGWLYMSSDNSTHSIYRANLLSGHVEELLRLPAPAGHVEVEGMALREVGDPSAPSLNMYILMAVDPDNSGQDLLDTNFHITLFRYELQQQANAAAAPGTALEVSAR